LDVLVFTPLRAAVVLDVLVFTPSLTISALDFMTCVIVFIWVVPRRPRDWWRLVVIIYGVVVVVVPTSLFVAKANATFSFA
jgi:hypothetical protein